MNCGEDARMTFSPDVAALVDDFHARKPARIWSLIVTLYGDAIVPRGGSLWIGSLIEIMGLFGIDAGHVRTAVSRLSSDGWLSSNKRGRASYYRLSRSGEDEFLQATQRIYSPPAVRQGELRVAALGPAVEDAAALRIALTAAGYAPISPLMHVGLGAPPPSLHQSGVFILTPEEKDKRALASAAWNLDDIGQAYRDFIARFSPLAEGLDRRQWQDDEALVARTLLIHAFRRVVLRDPALPADLLPADWSGAEARALATRLYAGWAEPSERYLSAQGRNEEGPLPLPTLDIGQRFSS